MNEKQDQSNQPLEVDSTDEVTEDAKDLKNEDPKNSKSKKKHKVSKSTIDEVKLLKTKLADKEQELLAANDQMLRIRAEFDNVRRRMETEKLQTRKLSEEKLLLELLPILDSFDRATDSYQEDHPAKVVFQGLELIHKQFEDTFKKLGVKRIDCLGQKFDPNFHDAMLNQDSTEHEENTILNVCRQGYSFKDKIIRHAQVIIAKKAHDKESEAEPNVE